MNPRRESAGIRVRIGSFSHRTGGKADGRKASFLKQLYDFEIDPNEVNEQSEDDSSSVGASPVMSPASSPALSPKISFSDITLDDMGSSSRRHSVEAKEKKETKEREEKKVASSGQGEGLSRGTQLKQKAEEQQEDAGLIHRHEPLLPSAFAYRRRERDLFRRKSGAGVAASANLNLRICTWNLGNKEPIDFNAWLPQDGNDYDMIVVSDAELLIVARDGNNTKHCVFVCLYVFLCMFALLRP